MKINLLLPVLLAMTAFFASINQSKAQGRFIIGTNPITFTYDQTKSISQYSEGNTVQGDTIRTTATAVKAHISLFAGYFITKNICAGLSFDANSTGTYSTFIRYYFNHPRPDSAKFDFFIQANGTISYSNTDHPYYTTNNTLDSVIIATSDYKVSQSTISAGLGFAAAYRFTRHWALEAEIGCTLSNSNTITGSYTTTDTYYDKSGLRNTNSLNTTPALKNSSMVYEPGLKLMLSYRL
jgi:hypothetical protein